MSLLSSIIPYLTGILVAIPIIISELIPVYTNKSLYKVSV